MKLNINSIPNKAQEVYFEWHEENGLLIQTDRGKIKVVNHTGAQIWELIDGVKTVSEISSLLQSNFHAKIPSIHKDLVDFLDQLKSRSLIYLKEE